MKKTEQRQINEIVEKAYPVIMAELRNTHGNYGAKQLRSCSATVLVTTNYFILRSYKTIVAAIDRNTGIMYDFLRMVYGYTATSAQHITKFGNDYKRVVTRRYYPV